MSKKADAVIVWLFAVFLASFFLLNLFWPDSVFSEKENRYLQTAPSLSVTSLLNGEYMSQTENYCSDQFIARDGWIAFKARLELLQGKKENNGVFLCENERLIEPFAMPEASLMDRQIRYVDQLTDSVSVPVALALIPTSAEFYRYMLPAGVRCDSQRDAIEYVYAQTHARCADILGALEPHREEYIFYRTDHHWTSHGARWAYAALAETLGISERSAFHETTVSDSFLGTTYSTSGFFWVQPDHMETLVDEPPGVTVERYDKLEPEMGALYVESMLETKDKYRFYLGGNTPCAVIRTGNEGRPSLLIIRDSFADSLVPFLLQDYAEIHLLDLRYYRESVLEYIQTQKIDNVLLLYSTDNFFSDNNLALITR